MVAGFRVYEAGPAGAFGDLERHSTPIVLVHGMGSSLDFWTAVAPRIAQHRHVIAFDLPGFGLTPKPHGSYDLKSVAEECCRLLDVIQAHPCVIVGHSLGALAAAQMVVSHPEDFRSLVLVDPVWLTVEQVLTRWRGVFGYPRVAGATVMQFLAALIPGSLSCAALAKGLVPRGLVRIFFRCSPVNVDLLRVAFRFVGGKAAINVLRVLPAARKVHLRELMDRVRLPVSLAWGDADPLFTPDDRDACRTALDVIGEKVFSDCAHFPMLEAVDDLVEFLANV